ncbi:MAG TPA: UDP-N-acetylmuramoyl-L-alanyl-D-glutamate--2,6-diaminopimelate ligase [Bacillota bacterium]|nr:UDP-N-acetylmuramoyl-L-alanyl-D-glutamate--2,6-diaminopimelate ligase [Bacillota bacterium]
MKRICTLSEYEKVLRSRALIRRSLSDEALLSAPVCHITYDSRDVIPGSLFVCKGAGFREGYLTDALDRGAIAWIAEQEHDQGSGIVVTDIRKAMAHLANQLYGEPWRDFLLIGLTGTKGKSTTVYFLRSIFDGPEEDAAEKRFGYLSSIETYDGKVRFESHLTTPEALVLAEHFDHVRESGLCCMAMEVSSQALKYDRTLGVEFDIGCFLNFGSDHIGGREHTDVEDYFSSKLKFFEQCKTVCLNVESDGLDRIIAAVAASRLCEKRILYSPSGKAEWNGLPVDFLASDVHKEDRETVFRIHRRCGAGSSIKAFEDLGEFRLTLPGLFNVDNALVATVVALALGSPLEQIKRGLYGAKVAGRMEVFENAERKLVVIVDYAHNRMSFDSLFSSTKKEYPGWRIEALFGCPGGKGLQRRWELPQVVAQYADFAWITEEDAGEEDLMEISNLVQKNLDRYGCPGRVIPDREEAIRTAIDNASPETVLVMTGKGRENYQKRGTEYVTVDSDVELVQKYL